MNRRLAARCLAELGNLTRLDIYRLLVRAGPAGLIVGEIQSRLGVPASTLAFHLRGLINVGLLEQEKIDVPFADTGYFDGLHSSILLRSLTGAVSGSRNRPKCYVETGGATHTGNSGRTLDRDVRHRLSDRHPSDGELR